MMKNTDCYFLKTELPCHIATCNCMGVSRIRRDFLPLRWLFSYESKLLKCFSVQFTLDYMKYCYGFNNKKLQKSRYFFSPSIFRCMCTMALIIYI